MMRKGEREELVSDSITKTRVSWCVANRQSSRRGMSHGSVFDYWRESLMSLPFEDFAIHYQLSVRSTDFHQK